MKLNKGSFFELALVKSFVQAVSHLLKTLFDQNHCGTSNWSRGLTCHTAVFGMQYWARDTQIKCRQTGNNRISVHRQSAGKILKPGSGSDRGTD